MTKSNDERIRKYARRIVDQAPPLSVDQRARLAVLIRREAEGDPPLTLAQRDRLGVLLRPNSDFSTATDLRPNALDEMLGSDSDE